MVVIIQQKYKTGDVVQLRSGGPSMTVRSYEPTDGDEVICEWFDKNGLIEKAFHQETLIPYKDPIIFSTPSVRSIKNHY